MKLTKYIFYLSLIIPISSFFSCEVVVDVDLDVGSRPVLNMILSPNNSFTCLLNESLANEDAANLYSEDSPFNEIKDASIRIKATNETEITLDYQTLPIEDAYFLPVDGVYYNELQPEFGKTYSITAEIPNFETITAETTFPSPVIIQNVDTSTYFGKIDPLDIGSEADNYLKFVVEFENNPNEQNFYGIKIRNTQGTNPYFVLPLYQNIGRDLDYYRGFQIFNDDLLEEGTVQLEILIDYYKLYDYYYGEYPEDPIENTDLNVVLATFNKDMYQYIESAKKQTQSDGFLEELFFEPVNVYSNINNGLGIFAAMSTDTLLVDM